MQNITKENIVLTEISESAYKWLRHSGHRINKQFIKSEIITHPDYPALTSLTDLLDLGNLEYSVQRATIEDCSTFNFPCIVNLQLANGNSGLYQADNFVALENVKKYWNGIIIHADSNSKWQHDVNDQMLLKSKNNTLALFCFGMFLLILSLVVGMSSQNPSLILAWLFTSSAGIMISVLLLSQELGLATEIVQKVCGIGGNKTGCASVLNSKYAKGKFGISIAMIAFIYFGVQWIFFICSPYSTLAIIASSTIIRISSIGIVIAGWSIYTQKFVIKNWCMLCLGLVTILLFQFYLSIINTSTMSWFGTLYFAIGYILIMALSLPIKKLIEKLTILESKDRDLNRWKKDTYLFLHQWSTQPEINCQNIVDELELANENAEIKFTVACNPFCNPCANTHMAMEKLLKIYGEYISVKVRFNTNPKDENNQTTQAVNLIINASKVYENPREVVHEWFNNMDIKKFLEKYPKTTTTHNDTLIIKQNEWFEAADIKFTPTIFLNNKEFPKRYQLSDLMVMIPEIYDQILHNKI